MLQHLGGKEAPHPCFSTLGADVYIYLCATCRRDDLEGLVKSLLSNDEEPDI